MLGVTLLALTASAIAADVPKPASTSPNKGVKPLKVFILAGVGVISRFHWVIYIFGAFLVYTGVKMMGPKADAVTGTARRLGTGVAGAAALMALLIGTPLGAQESPGVRPVAEELGAADFLAIPARNSAERQIARQEEGASLREIFEDLIQTARAEQSRR